MMKLNDRLVSKAVDAFTFEKAYSLALAYQLAESLEKMKEKELKEVQLKNELNFNLGG